MNNAAVVALFGHIIGHVTLATNRTKVLHSNMLTYHECKVCKVVGCQGWLLRHYATFSIGMPFVHKMYGRIGLCIAVT